LTFLSFFESVVGLEYATAAPEVQWILAGGATITAVAFTVLLLWGLFLFVKGLAHGK